MHLPTLLSLLTLATATLPTHCPQTIIGAGIAGIYTAFRLSVDTRTLPARAICLFEAKPRPGGRILTVHNPAPAFENYTLDLGAYRFHRASHALLRALTEDALSFSTLCYADPLARGLEPCDGTRRRIVSTRGRLLPIRSNGTDAEHTLATYSRALPYRVKSRYQWGPGKPLPAPRNPYDLVLGPRAVIAEIADRFAELSAETDYRAAMRIADEIIFAMRNGSYRGMPYSEVSALQAATAEGYTTEELQLVFDAGFADNFFLRHSLEHLGQLLVREEALAKKDIGLKALVTPVEIRDGAPRRIGMTVMLDKMLKLCAQKGVKIFYGAKVTGITRASAGSKKLRLAFADGSVVTTNKIVANIGKPDLIALGLESEPLKSSTDAFRRAVERNFVTGASKTYCFWEDAWWLTKLGQYFGRVRTAEETMQSMRYHDGHVTCEDRKNLKKCRGGLLVSYSFGDSSGAGMAIHAHGHNAFPYTPLTNTDNVHRLVPGNMTGIEQLYFDDLVAQIRRVHASSFAAKGMNVKDAIQDPVGCLFADWRDVGIHTEMGPGKGSLNIYKLFARPVPDLDISLANEAWGQDQGWAEGSLRSAETALFHQYGVQKPKWLDEAFHTSVIMKFNQG